MPDPSDEFEASLDGFPTEIDPRHVRSRETVEVLASEFADKARAGLRPSIDEYVARYPQLTTQIRELFPLVAALEQWKTDRQSELLREQLPEKFNFDRLGDCRIVREIGRGGMGVVFEARQGSYDRRVAVKVLPWRISLVPERQARFEREAMTISRLKHPNIVQIYSVGSHQDYAYYVMQYVKSVSLSLVIDRLRETESITFAEEIARSAAGSGDAARSAAPIASRELKPLTRTSWKSFAGIALQVAQALRHAHGRGILHNDVKPGNLLIDADSRVWVTDFGLAVDVGDAASDSSDHVNGTLRYMAPERFDGVSNETSDVYSLGITLFELVTLTPAFETADRHQLLDWIGRGELVDPRSINPDVPSDLRYVILKAVAHAATDRYQSVGEFATDLLRFINNEPVRARPKRSLFGWLRKR